ncbi:beta subunit of citrate lyase [Gloeophyllum trabeum ATCC 11539]|uniref:Beta subunit of citrate lyase n=1 Tax=Gloeophyllum trabeum (strain ATCC 11539 / FP-39264 / Madison 617) TaxID=670483 RepID=S7RPH4_GLOTA|nr:beta subunit of citrate lyase [Gloeophyllum trabeum ATCC 11539]EPQ54754.1 beta subunit of citrate lyase [Gloeophyllum trabeum ATCC 11539]
MSLLHSARFSANLVVKPTRSLLAQGAQARRWNSTVAPNTTKDAQLKRSYLYVPATSEKMLHKSTQSNSDVIIYDLEDSVPPSKADKSAARHRLVSFIRNTSNAVLPRPARVGVRVNGLGTEFFHQDILQLTMGPNVRTVLMPKIHSASDLDAVSNEIHLSRMGRVRDSPECNLNIIASIESAQGLWNVGEIAAWQSKHGASLGGRLSALLFAAEDYCADTSIIRTQSRQELLYARSRIVNAAKAFGLQAIDMVCVNYKDLDYLREECEDGRRLGFNGKQAIHPSQVDIIQSTYVPTEKEILRAAKILHQMSLAHSAERGAVGIELEGGGKEMVDAPMLKQAINTINIAKAAGLKIPEVA